MSDEQRPAYPGRSIMRYDAVAGAYQWVMQEELPNPTADPAAPPATSWELPPVYTGAEDAPDVWAADVAPGGYVCGVCRTPVESEPCPTHQPRATARLNDTEGTD
jgi:hypothetical protein